MRSYVVGVLCAAAVAVATADAAWAGLRNQGNTCYLNALLQTLFHVPKVRDEVIKTPRQRGPLSRLRPKKMAPALAGVFARLRGNATAKTGGLTRALGVAGWQQQDAQEYLRLLVGGLLESDAGSTLKATYEGELENYLEATSEEAERLGERPRRTRAEPFYDVGLDVVGAGDVEAALRAYLEPELMAGDNRWKSDAGPCDALRGVRFAALPPVLVLHLKRFAFDYARDQVRKLGDRVEVPFVLGRAAFAGAACDAEVAEGEEPEPAPTDDDPYLLHAVVVHLGGGTGGHYYAYVDPLLDGRWVRFDDDRVSAVDRRVVAAEAAGADLGGGASVGAYLLQYVRRSEAAGLGLSSGGG